jgi:hypothetical protein
MNDAAARPDSGGTTTASFGLLGLDDADIAQLAAKSVIGIQPLTSQSHVRQVVLAGESKQ